MPKKADNRFCSCSDYVVDDNDTVAWMAELCSVKSQITSKKRGVTLPVQISQDLLLVVPLGPTYMNPNLSKANSIFPEFR